MAGDAVKAAVMLAMVLAAASRVAQAHLTNTGLGPFYDGLAHLFVTPEELLPVITLALLAGLRGPRFGRAVLFALPAACVAGSLVPASVTGLALPAGAAVTLGVLVAADRRLPLGVVAGLAIALGVLDGSGSGLRSLGLGVGGLVVIAVVAGNVAQVEAWWARVAVRVGGSWIAASGLLMLGWAMRAR